MIKTKQVDVLIIGTGIAGLSAAYTIGTQAKVAVLSKAEIKKTYHTVKQNYGVLYFQTKLMNSPHIF
jgi:succinate dehydrogenase/fumarate reductase flavoprotein subunit